MSRQQHWESVYQSKGDDQVSWTQPDPSLSLSLIREACPSGGRVIDVGGGSSPLASRLLESGYDVAVLDVSAAALARAQARLDRSAAERIRWIVADVTQPAPIPHLCPFDLGGFDLWHDRAVFHFFTEAADRAAYVSLLTRTIQAGGFAVIATFAPDGPEQCSGLPVRRYDGPALGAELGAAFERIKTVPETHLTPWGKPQSFQYSVFKRLAP